MHSCPVNAVKAELGCHWSATIPQQVALTAVWIQVSAYVWVMFLTNDWIYIYWHWLNLESHLFVKEFTTKTPPKRSTYEHKNHLCLCLRPSECDCSGSFLHLRTDSHICYVQPPQQVALTVEHFQVSAGVRSIPHACSELWSFPVVLSSLFEFPLAFSALFPSSSWSLVCL